MNLASPWASSTHSMICIWLESPTKKQTRTLLWRFLARARVPMMIWFSSGLGRNRRRLWRARLVTSTRAPPSGMKRSRRLIPQKTENRPQHLFVLEPLGFARGVNEPFRYFRTGGRWATCPHPGFSEGLQGASLRHPVRRSLPGRREERELPRPPAAGGPTVELGKKDEGAGIGDPETHPASSRAARISASICSSRRLIAATPIRSSSRRKVIRFMPAKRAAFPEDRRPIS